MIINQYLTYSKQVLFRSQIINSCGGGSLAITSINNRRHYVSRTNTKKNSVISSLLAVPDMKDSNGMDPAASPTSSTIDTESVTATVNGNNISNAEEAPDVVVAQFSEAENPTIIRNIIDSDILRQSQPVTYIQPSYIDFLQTLPSSKMFSLAIIGICSINKFILDKCIKLFPFVPLPVVKILISDLYCGGETFKDVQKCGLSLKDRGISNMMLSLTIEDSNGSKNMASENINYIVNQTIESVHNVLKPHIIKQLETCNDVNSIAPGYIALKPSALVENPSDVLKNFNNPKWITQREELIRNCSKITQQIFNINKELSQKYPNRTAPFLISTIDAEKFDLQINGVYDLQRILMSKFNTKSSRMTSVIGTWQLYLKDSLNHLQKEYKLANQNNYKLGLKLVRGAYIHSEERRNDIIFNNKSDTDNNYNQIILMVMQDMINNGDQSTYGHLMIASHNYQSQMMAAALLKEHEDNEYIQSNVTMGQLLGMADNISFDLINNHKMKNVIKYVPWGPAIETRDYLLRRLQENGDAVRSDNGLPLLKNIMNSIFSKYKRQ